jgi:tetratricopeptide (TPR) repeat protein
MERTTTETLRRAWEDMRRRYHFTPRTPVHIEMFSDPQHFSVRTSGLPNVGVQGVCFGQVVTALSPRGGPFNWAQITWHEVAHVFHIQMSNNRVPRWFTEGLAEYETIIARPEWRREEDHRLYMALASGRLPQVAQLNHAFTHARTGEDMTVAYYASSMLVKYIAERFDFDHVVRMLREWGQGRSDAQVVQRSLGISIDQLDHDFREHTRQRLAGRASDFAVDFAANADLEAARARAQQAPGDASAHAGLAASLLVNGQGEEAMQEVRAALRIDRNEPTARFVAAQIAARGREPRRAFGDLRLLIEGGHDGYEVRLLQARVAFGVRNYTLGREALQRATQIDPERPEAWQGLMQLAERTQQSDLRLEALRRVVDIDQHTGEMNFELMQALAERNEWDGVRTYGERSIFVDPLRAEARRLYAEALVRTGDPREGLAQADVALLAHPEQPGLAHLTRARALAALRRGREAREAADAAVAADPNLREQAQSIGR